MRILRILVAFSLLGSSVALAQEQVDYNNPPPPLAKEFGPLDSVADNVTIADFLEPGDSHTTNEEIGSEEGAFRGNCFPTHNAYSDPIVYPGFPGKSPHLHTNFGNRQGLTITSYAERRTVGLSSCYNVLWRSAYWVTAMIRYKADGTRDVRMPYQVDIYYKRPGKNMAQCIPGTPTYIGRCVALPNGMVGIAGYDMLSGTSPSGQISFNCIIYTNQNSGGYGGPTKTNIVDAAGSCPAFPGTDTGVKKVLNWRITFPSCWNGVDLDSPNHRSHLADMFYHPETGRLACPATHPYHMWRYTAQFKYEMDSHLPTDGVWYSGRPGWYLDSDRMHGVVMKKPGTTAHFDLADALSPYMKRHIEDNCIDRVLSCNNADLGNGQRLKRIWTASVPQIRPRPFAAKEPSTVHIHPPR
jgi:hypothetical protein